MENSKANNSSGRCRVCRSPADLVDYQKVLKLFFIPMWQWLGQEPLVHYNNYKLFFPHKYSLSPPKADSTAYELLQCNFCDRRVESEFRLFP